MQGGGAAGNKQAVLAGELGAEGDLVPRQGRRALAVGGQAAVEGASAVGVVGVEDGGGGAGEVEALELGFFEVGEQGLDEAAEAALEEVVAAGRPGDEADAGLAEAVGEEPGVEFGA